MNRLLVVLLALALAACGGGGGGSSAAPSASSPSSATVTASPSPTGPTIAEVASVVAQSQAEVEKVQTDLAADCDWTDSVGALACYYVVIRAQAVAQILMTKLGKFKNPPTEIQPLIRATLQSAKVIADTDVRDCGKDAESVSCEATKVAISSSVQSLLETLAGWKPYS